MTERSGIGGWGKAGRAQTYYLQNALPASDAPVADFPGHRRDNVRLQNRTLVAALPQPPRPLNVR